jgi:pimeloyl-ACP methyl ester carboxylesterase
MAEPVTLSRRAVAAALLAVPTAAFAKAWPRSERVNVGPCELHVLDWGGSGPALVLLAGLGDTAWVFSDVAPGLASRFRVLAITRRGFGSSDIARAGYDLTDRAGDIHAVMDARGIRRAILAGHSAAGDELTAFATAFPDRASGLLYLDAAYDRADPVAPKKTAAAWNRLLRLFYGNESDAAIEASLDAQRAARARLFRLDQGVAWTRGLELNLRDTVVVDADGTVSPRTPSWVPRLMTLGVQKAKFDLSAIACPAVLIYNRGPVPAAALAGLDKPTQAAILDDEADYGRYFDGFLDRVRRQNPRLDILVQPQARHYDFLGHPERLPAQLARLTSQPAFRA